jgi:exoribonuclease II
MGKKRWINSSFSFSTEDIPLVENVEKIANDDGVSVSQIIIMLLEGFIRTKNPIETKQQTHLEPYIENSEFVPEPSTSDPMQKWIQFAKDSDDLDYLDERIRKFRTIANIYDEQLKIKHTQKLHESIAKRAAAARGGKTLTQ